ncbi:MAG: 1-deoxy-D-xylulose-5-phosphate synthase [Clostridia bacterium]|nr:1-deoxy-D-xylulose-5-phosphate synthase [Clostridia bacterium]
MKIAENYKYLGKINTPQELKGLSKEEIPEFAAEIRKELVSRVSENGGHLASNLGVVELTLALHRVFDCPHDHVIFDVGHQSYVHKMLTGRFARMDTLRKPGGLSGFTNISESEYDAFGAGHSSTSLSAGLGFAMADRLTGSDAYTVVVLGDGAYTGGMIHEALNNCEKNLKLIIILNENEISISKNIGRFAEHLARLRNKSSYFKTKKFTEEVLHTVPPLYRIVRRTKKGLKSALYGSNYFESMGITYLGPVDGNNFEKTESLLREAKKLGECVLVHVRTKKGKGYEPAETDPSRYHGVSPAGGKKETGKCFSEIMGEKLTQMAAGDSRICAITAAMCDGTGLCSFKEAHKERFFDVGIAEEHALTFAAGLAANGMRPVAAIYSSFLQRGYDNIIHDIALQNLPVTICVDRAGLNAADGATHHGLFDVAFLSGVPNMTIYTPVTAKTLEKALAESVSLGTPSAVRYPRGGENARINAEFYACGAEEKPLGAVANFAKDETLDAVVITDGIIAAEALAACDKARENGVRAGIILLEKIKPYGECAENVAHLLPRGVKKIIFLEEEIRAGGMGMLLSDEMHRRGMLYGTETEIMAVDDTFVKRNAGKTMYEDAGISADDIYKVLVK